MTAVVVIVAMTVLRIAWAHLIELRTDERRALPGEHARAVERVEPRAEEGIAAEVVGGDVVGVVPDAQLGIVGEVGAASRHLAEVFATTPFVLSVEVQTLS